MTDKVTKCAIVSSPTLLTRNFPSVVAIKIRKFRCDKSGYKLVKLYDNK